MHDKIFIFRNETAYAGERFLRTGRGGVLQSVFYLNRCRSDPTLYARFAGDDPAMNVAAAEMLGELVDEAAKNERAMVAAGG
jgi:hypothetical protein